MNNFIKINNKKILTALVIMLVFGFYDKASATETTLAAPQNNEILTIPNCSLKDPIDKLSQIKEKTLKEKDGSNLDSLGQDEFTARRELLNAVIKCSRDEIKFYNLSLERLNRDLEPKDNLIKEKFLIDLKALSLYLDKINDGISNNAITLGNIKATAKEMLDWREGFYVPLLPKIQTFILIIESRSAEMTARARLNKIRDALSNFKLDEKEDLKPILAQSSSLLDESAEMLIQASSDFYELHNFFPRENNKVDIASTSLEVAQDNKTDNKTDEKEEIIKSPIINNDYILVSVSNSLLNIKKSYQNFLKISVKIKNVIGL